MLNPVEEFPDIHHLVYLRNRLWARKPLGRAAVMVGAGFSLNAESRLGKSSSFPLWTELTGLMLDRLRPMLTSKERKAALDSATAGSASLTLALEFEATFGRSALDDLIISAIPDKDHSPGLLHETLLSLPWADVFTTNYDTLLERTRSTDQGRYYDVVVQPSDLPNSTQPRIFKLHGSLPATKPFIITEEDFRRYPRTFAPFVNTVQQSMMENDFVLLGFSGSDPNFLSWLGWVRDELSTLKARVYLCGVLDLDNAQRLVLRERGVTAIDLGWLFPKSTYKDDKSKRNQDALLWFIKSLQNGEKLDLSIQWPIFKVAADKQQQFRIQPLGDTSNKEKPREISHPSTRPTYNAVEKKLDYSDEFLAGIVNQIENWSLTRQLYPGWIVLPRENRDNLYSKTSGWRSHIINWAATLPAEKRLLPLYELVWRIELCMLVTDTTKEEELIKQTIAELPVPDDSVGQEQWATIAFYRLKQLRYDYNYQEFHELLAAIEPLAEKQTKYAAWRCWHATLERLEHLDHKEAQRWLRQWPDVNNDPIWDLRKAGLWAELGELETAERYASAVLDTAMQQQPRTSIRIDMLSVEEAARHLLTDIRRAKWFQGDRTDPKENLWDASKDELARDQLYSQYRCNTYLVTDRLKELLKAPEPEIKLSIYETVNPYTGLRSRTQTTGGGIDLDNYQPCFDMLDIHEKRGRPAALPNITSEGIGLAANWLVNIHSTRALGIAIRSCNENLLKHVLNKSVYVKENIEPLQDLLDKALTILEQNFPAAGAGYKPLFTDRNKTKYIGLALHLIGQAAFRLNNEQRIKAIQIALGVWDNWPRELLESRNLYIDKNHYSAFAEGITSVMLPEEVTEHLSLLISITPEPQFSSGVFVSIPDELLPPSRPDTPAIADAIRTCIQWLLSPEESIQQVALRRLLDLQELGWLKDEELDRFGENVWNKYMGAGKLPEFEYAPALWVTLTIPAPDSISVAARLKQRLLTSAQSYANMVAESPDNLLSGTRGFDRLLFNTIQATVRPPAKLVTGKLIQRKWIEWGADEILFLFNTLEAMLNSQEHLLISAQQTRKGVEFGGGLDLSAEDEFYYAGQFLRDVIIPQISIGNDLAERVLACTKKLLQYELPARSALPPLLSLLGPTSPANNYTATSIRLALADPTNARVVQDGVEAVCRWAYGANRGVLPNLPNDLFYEFITRLGMPGLPNLLAVVRWSADLMVAAPRIFWPAYAQQLGDALQLLLDETAEATSWSERIMARSITTKERLFQRPSIREQTARLAGQITWLNAQEPIQLTDEILTEWQQSASADARPEVRRAWSVGYENMEMRGHW